MNHWAIKQKVQLISTLSRFFLSRSIFFIYLLYSRAAQRKVVRVCIFTHTLLQTPEIQQYLFQQSHLSKRPTSSRYATPFTSEPCEIASHLFPRPKGYAYSWKRPTVIRSLGRGYKKAGPTVVLYFVSRTTLQQGSGLQSFGCADSLLALFLGIYSLHKFEVGKREKMKTVFISALEKEKQSVLSLRSCT